MFKNDVRGGSLFLVFFFVFFVGLWLSRAGVFGSVRWGLFLRGRGGGGGGGGGGSPSYRSPGGSPFHWPGIQNDWPYRSFS